MSHLLKNALVISFHCATCNHVSVLLKQSRKMLSLATILDLNNSIKAMGQRGAVDSLSFVNSNPSKGSCCFLELVKLPSLLSTGWFQEWIQVNAQNATKLSAYGLNIRFVLIIFRTWMTTILNVIRSFTIQVSIIFYSTRKCLPSV